MSRRLDNFAIALCSSQKGPYRWGRRVLFWLGVATLAVYLYQFLRLAGSPHAFARDYWQDYLMAKAFLLGFNPYLPLSDLPALLGIELEFSLWSHPSPHPPFAILLNLPFALLSPSMAHQIFACLQILTLWVFAGVLLDLFNTRAASGATSKLQLPLFFVLLFLPPMREELFQGQVNLLAIYILLCSLRFERNSRSALSGIFLAIALSLKASFALVIVAFLFSRAWKSLLSFGLAFLALHSLLMGVFGVALVRDYYLVVAPFVANFYAISRDNSSLWVIPANLFLGAEHYFATTAVNLPPCLPPEFRSYHDPLRYLVVVLAFGAIFLSLRLKSLTERFLYLLALSALLSPIVWQQALLYALPLMFYLWVDSLRRGAGAWELGVLLLLCLVSLYPIPFATIERKGEIIAASSCMPDLLIAKQALFKVATLLVYFYLRFSRETPHIPPAARLG